MTDRQMWRVINALLNAMIAFAALGVATLVSALMLGKSATTGVGMMTMAIGELLAGGSIIVLCCYDICWRRR